MKKLQHCALATVAAISALSLVPASRAEAEDAPNLVGTWKGETLAVQIGPNPYRIPETNGANFPDNLIEFTYVVTRQEGTRFAGHTEGKFTEDFIGMLKPPEYRSGIFIDDDGQYDFTLRDDRTIDMCYWHQYPTSKVVACWTLTKQP
jgi:hypothetical protein